MCRERSEGTGGSCHQYPPRTQQTQHIAALPRAWRLRTLQRGFPGLQIKAVLGAAPQDPVQAPLNLSLCLEDSGCPHGHLGGWKCCRRMRRLTGGGGRPVNLMWDLRESERSKGGGTIAGTPCSLCRVSPTSELGGGLHARVKSGPPPALLFHLGNFV